MNSILWFATTLAAAGALTATHLIAAEVVAPSSIRGAKIAASISAAQGSLVEIARATLPAGISAKQRSTLEQIAALYQSGKEADGRAAWTAFVTTHGKGLSSEEIAVLAQWVLRSRLMATGTLGGLADAVGYYQELLRTIRDHLTALQNLMVGMGAARTARGDELVVNMTFAPGRSVVESRTPHDFTKTELERAIDDWNARLQTVDDVRDEATLRLQDAANKQQEAVQMISATSKACHDMAKSIIGNLKG